MRGVHECARAATSTPVPSAKRLGPPRVRPCRRRLTVRPEPGDQALQRAWPPQRPAMPLIATRPRWSPTTNEPVNDPTIGLGCRRGPLQAGCGASQPGSSRGLC